MENNTLKDLISAPQTTILTSQSDLDPKDRPMLSMHPWCERQGDIVVMNSGLILTNNPQSRSVQNCKMILQQKSIRPGKVIAASQALIDVLLANAEAASSYIQLEAGAVSVQQQRLRILVREAIAAQASDIHIEVRQDIARIRFRRHGELYLHAEWLPRLGREIAYVAFNKETDHANTHFNPTIPQNASMPLHIDDMDVRLRLASLPAHGGFDVVMRVLTAGIETPQTLEELGYTPEQITIISEAIRMPHGAIIMAGPTGSGKTTTLASCMAMVSNERKAYTIEDPIEKIVRAVTQVPVNTEKEDRDFASMGRAALRMDPDVIVLGEMRDEETARVMVRAAVTGHLVFSTLHTNTAPAIVTRLVDMGISPMLLGDTNLLVCLICQRLIPKLCLHCAQPVSLSSQHKKWLPRWAAVFGSGVDQLRVRGSGCTQCKGVGINGRTVVAEVVWVDEAGRRFIQQCDTFGWEKYLRERGWRSYRDRTLELVAQGICDPLDAEKIVGVISTFFKDNGFDYRDIYQKS